MYAECSTSVSSICLITGKRLNTTSEHKDIYLFHHTPPDWNIHKDTGKNADVFSFVLWFWNCYMQLDRHGKAHRHIFATLPCEHVTKSEEGAI